jgi:hypothetical protein
MDFTPAFRDWCLFQGDSWHVEKVEQEEINGEHKGSLYAAPSQVRLQFRGLGIEVGGDGQPSRFKIKIAVLLWTSDSPRVPIGSLCPRSSGRC